MYTLETPIWQLTVGEFVDLHKKIVADTVHPPAKDYTEKKYVYGLSGLAALLNCSRTTAHAIKSSGKIDAAVMQEGRKIIIDSEKALQLLKK
jgi:hypothetical protein